MSVSCSSSKVELQCKFMIVFTIITLFVSIYKIFGIRNKIISYMNFISNIINLFILYKICTDCKGTYYITYYLFTIGVIEISQFIYYIFKLYQNPANKQKAYIDNIIGIMTIIGHILFIITYYYL